MFHGGDELLHGGIKYSPEGGKHSMDVPNIPRRGLNNSQRGQRFHGGG